MSLAKFEVKHNLSSKDAYSKVKSYIDKKLAKKYDAKTSFYENEMTASGKGFELKLFFEKKVIRGELTLGLLYMALKKTVLKKIEEGLKESLNGDY